MWTHYAYGVLIVRYGFERNRLYQKVSTQIVFACLWLHPGILIYQLWASTQTLPPKSLIDYMGQANAMLLIPAMVAWLTFLSFDILIKFKKSPFWRRHWFWVSVSQALAMMSIYAHAIKLGRHIQVSWFKIYWALLGLVLVPAIIYLLWNELPNEGTIKKTIRRFMKNTKLLVVIGIAGLLMLGSAAYVGMTRNEVAVTPKETAPLPKTTTIALSEVQSNNGKSGAKCWVVVDTTVYEISGFAQWVDGVHTPSGGLARCGKDLTDVVGDSPHGRSVLRLLKVVGSYKAS